MAAAVVWIRLHAMSVVLECLHGLTAVLKPNTLVWL